MTFEMSRLGHVGINVSDVEQSIAFYRKVCRLKLTGNWRPPEAFRPVCFMRIGNNHHDLVLFELPKDIDRGELDTSDSFNRRSLGTHHIAFEFDFARGMAARARSRPILRRRDHLRTAGSRARVKKRAKLLRRQRQPRILFLRSRRQPHRILLLDDEYHPTIGERAKSRPVTLNAAGTCVCHGRGRRKERCAKVNSCVLELHGR